MTTHRQVTAPPPTPPRRRIRLASLMIGVVVIALAAAAVLSIVVTQDQFDAEELETTAAEQQRDAVAQDVQDLAGPQAALCRAGGDAGRALELAGLCDTARRALDSPIVQERTEELSADEIDDIVQRVLALTPPPRSVDDIVGEVLARMVADPELRGLSESEVRTIVAAAVASLPEPEPGPPGQPGADGEDGLPGASFGGLQFVREDGQCVAVVTFIDPDGGSRTQTVPVNDGACEPLPPPTTTTPPPTTEDPPPTVAPTTEPSPTTLPEDDGLLDLDGD